MKHKLVNSSIIAIACLLMLPLCAFAQLPAPTYGWNLGNTMEPPCGVGCWAPAPTQALINRVASAGFNTIRIPCAWDSHANQSTYQINSNYMAQVKQVVDWCYATNLYVIINDHWDGGWLENNIGTSTNATINAKMNSYWTQIANAFASYDNHLLFAGANEPNVSTAAQMSTLRAYYNTFISAVRSTGGNNTNRWLVVQGPNTDIDTTYSLMNTLPTDSTPGRLMVEIHYYTPWQFCGLTSDQSWGNMFYFWGAAYHSATLSARNPDWNCEESYLDAEFQKMTTKFVNVGVPVMVGEFGSVKRTTASYPDLTGENVDLHLASRTYFDKYVVNSANSHGLHPFYWDNGDVAGGTLFDRHTYTVVDPDSVRALTGGAALPPPGNTTPTTLDVSSSASPSTYGTPITFTATVKTNGVPLNDVTGEIVTFYDGPTELGTGSFKGNGSASLITASNQLAAGSHSIAAVYGGDAVYSGSTNNPAYSQMVDPLTASILSGVSANAKIYDATTAATLNFTNVMLDGVLSQDVTNVSLSTVGYTANFASPDAGTAILVSVSGLTLNGSAAGNYTLMQPAGLTADILPLETPIVTAMNVAPGTMQLTFSGQTGQNYRVLATSDLTLPLVQWSVLTNGTFGSGPVTFTDDVPPQTTSRFYRIASP